MTIRVVIADDQELVRTGFRVILASEPDIEVVGEAGDGLQAVEATRALRPDVVLMDIRMPSLDGIEATRRIAARAGSTRVVEAEQSARPPELAGIIDAVRNDAVARETMSRNGLQLLDGKGAQRVLTASPASLAASLIVGCA